MTPELSRLVRLAAIGDGLDVAVAASAAECGAIALRLDLPAVQALSAQVHLAPLGAGVILAEGDLAARMTRDCVVTTEPFESHHREHFRLRFVPTGQTADNPDPESDDEIPYAGIAFDLGEALVEQLALGLDPYPRGPDAPPA